MGDFENIEKGEDAWLFSPLTPALSPAEVRLPKGEGGESGWRIHTLGVRTSAW